ncbi:MAG: hypothetical protein DLM61_04460, partial [Pseudonocardiales bacterium]
MARVYSAILGSDGATAAMVVRERECMQQRTSRGRESSATPATLGAGRAAGRGSAHPGRRVIDPLLVHRALALSIEPEWTRGHAFSLEHTIDGLLGAQCFITVSDGQAVSVRTRPVAGGATTALRTTYEAFVAALGGSAEAAAAI